MKNGRPVGLHRPTRLEHDSTPAGSVVRFVAEVSYDGTDFIGYQTQPSGQTVQDVLEARLSVLCKRQVCIAAAGRTDAGVHALRQVVQWDYDLQGPHPMVFRRLGPTPAAADIASLFQSAMGGVNSNTGMPSTIQVLSVREAPPGAFHVRSSCTGKRYVYTLQVNSHRIVQLLCRRGVASHPLAQLA